MVASSPLFYNRPMRMDGHTEHDLSQHNLLNIKLPCALTSLNHGASTAINLASNGISDLGVKYVAKATKPLKSEVTLDLSHNRINDPSDLLDNDNVVSVDLSFNRINDEFGDYFATILERRNFTLLECKLEGNPIFNKDIQARIQATVERNCLLKEAHESEHRLMLR